MHQNSLVAFKTIECVTGEKRQKVYSVIDERKAITAKEIAETLNWPINCVTPRICELRDSGHVIIGGNTIQDDFKASLYAPINGEFNKGGNKMDADKYYGEYLKAEDVKQDVSVSIESVNLETIENEKKVVVSLVGFNKRLVLNKTNKDRLKKLFGTSETDNWINKQFTLTTEQVQYKGETVPALRVLIPVGANPPPQSIWEEIFGGL